MSAGCCLNWGLPLNITNDIGSMSTYVTLIFKYITIFKSEEEKESDVSLQIKAFVYFLICFFPQVESREKHSIQNSVCFCSQLWAITVPAC